MLKINKIAGVDEVGRGCLAGPVFAAAVILKKGINTSNIKDSKKTLPCAAYLNGEYNVKGFGIGLTIVKKVIEAHNGELIIKSENEKGATFTLRIKTRRLTNG